MAAKRTVTRRTVGPDRPERPTIPIWPSIGTRRFVPLDIGGLRYLSDLKDRSESFAVQKTLFLGFPEVLSGGHAAHHTAIGWCISRKAIIVNRDVFSAGGQAFVDIHGSAVPIRLPGVMKKAIDSLGRRCPVSLEDLSEIHGVSVASGSDAAALFRLKLERDVDLGALITYMPATNGGRRARSLIIDTLVDNIDTSGFVD
jgi:hypothetical protein